MDMPLGIKLFHAELSVCDQCKRPAKSLLSACSQCKVARYCSQVCQKRDWKEGHRILCSRLADGRNKATTKCTSSAERMCSSSSLPYDSERSCQWVLENAGNMYAIAAASLKNDTNWAYHYDVYIYILPVEPCKQSAAEFYISLVVLEKKEYSNVSLAGLTFEGGAPGARFDNPPAGARMCVVHAQPEAHGMLQSFVIFPFVLRGLTLPRGLDLSRFATYLGRGVASFESCYGKESAAGSLYANMMKNYPKESTERYKTQPV